MSTVDPRAAKAERARRAQGSAGALAWTVVVGLAVVAAAFLVGLGVAGWAGMMRDLSINAVEDWARDESLQIWLMVVGSAVGPLGAVLASMLYVRVAPRWTGGRLPVIGPFFLIMVGAMAGTAAGALSMPTTVTVGYTLDDGSARAWWFGDWFWYYEPIWLPALLGVGAVIALFAPSAARRRRARRLAWERALKRDGVERVGRISDVQSTGVVVNDVPRVRVTVAYTDATGVKRWVTRKGSRQQFHGPVPGREVTVWYDPARPDDESRILIDFSPVKASTRRRGKAPGRQADAGATPPAPSPAARKPAPSPRGDAPWGDVPDVDVPVAEVLVTDAPVTDAPVTDAPIAGAGAPGADAPDWGTPSAERRRATARILTVTESPTNVDGRPMVHLRLGLRVKPKDGGGSFLSNTELIVPARSKELADLRRTGTALPVLYTPGQLGEVTINSSYAAHLAGH